MSGTVNHLTRHVAPSHNSTHWRRLSRHRSSNNSSRNIMLHQILLLLDKGMGWEQRRIITVLLDRKRPYVLKVGVGVAAQPCL
jgi:hypothetical protein